MCRWMKGCDELVKKMCTSVNGPALEALAKATHYEDAECVNFFRWGAPLFGKLPCSINGKKQDYPQHASLENLRDSVHALNRKLIASLKEDKHSEVLWKQVLVLSQ